MSKCRFINLLTCPRLRSWGHFLPTVANVTFYMENKPEKRKSKFGRKPLKDDEKRNILLTLSFNKNEHESLQAHFKKTGQKEFAVFLRELVLNQNKNVRFVPEVNKQVRVDIRRMGNNLNQIAKQLNQQFGSVTSLEFSKKIAQIEEELKVLLASINT